VAKQQIYPFAFTSAYTQEAGEYFSVADADGLIPDARLLRSAWDDWRAKHRWLMAQGHTALNASLFLLSQTETKPAQPPAQPQPGFAPQPAPSPFAEQPPMRAANGR
jgi:hypothetical protein